MLMKRDAQVCNTAVTTAYVEGNMAKETSYLVVVSRRNSCLAEHYSVYYLLRTLLYYTRTAILLRAITTLNILIHVHSEYQQ